MLEFAFIVGPRSVVDVDRQNAEFILAIFDGKNCEIIAIKLLQSYSFIHSSIYLISS